MTVIMNTNNQLPLVTYEQAQRLKKAGFDWPTWWYYSEFYAPGRNPTHLGYDYCHNKSDFGGLSAPTVALALKWMRDVKGKFGELRATVCSDPIGVLLGWDVVVFGMPAGNPRYGDPAGSFDTYEAAESALLDELLNIIENNGKNKKN